MIPESVIVDFKNASAMQKKMVKRILLNHYEELLDEFIKDADYVTTTSYWKDIIPHGKKTDARDFILKYQKKYLLSKI